MSEEIENNWIRDWSGSYKLVAYRHSVGIDDLLEEDIKSIASISNVIVMVGPKCRSVGLDFLDKYVSEIIAPSVDVYDKNKNWCLRISNVEGFAILGISRVLSDKFGKSRAIRARDDFIDYVTRGGVGFGATGKRYALEQICPYIWSE